jgi:O-antigen/teichoic acid export membrane protein
MLSNFGLVGISRLFLMFAQIFIVYLLSQNYTPKDLGTYMLIVAISLPSVNFLLLDVPSKVLTDTVKNRNILEILGFKIIIAFILLLGTICFQLTEFSYISEFMVLFTAVFYIKAGQAVLELEIAELKKEEHFKELFWLIIKSQLSVYLVMALMMLKTFDLVFVYAASAFVSCCVAALSLIRLTKKGWFAEFCLPLAYLRSEFHLGVAVGLKFLTSNLLRFVAIAIYGVTTLGYMAPAFYSFTILSNLGTIVENIITPKILKRIDIGEFSFSAFKVEFLFVLILSLIISFSSYFLADDYYRFFFPDKIDEYSGMIIIFSLGYFFYVFRSVIKIVSFKFGLAKWQVFIQLLFSAVLILSILLMHGFAGVYGLALSYVIASIFICIFYLIIIFWHFSKKDPPTTI